MQANQTQVVWTIVIAAVILLVVGLFSVSSVNQNLKLIDVDVDEQAIADAVLEGIVIPEVNIPEMPEIDTEKLNEVWNHLNGEEFVENEFKDTVETFALSEFDSEEAVDKLGFSGMYLLFNELVGDFVLDEVTTTVTEVGDYKLDEYFLNELHNNRGATVVMVYDFKFNKDNLPIDDIYEGSITITGTYTQLYDTVDEVYEDAEIVFAYAMS